MAAKEVQVIKNTIFMFLRMAFVMFLTLFSTRLLLKTLGIELYGIYDLIFGIVLLFNAFSATITTSIQRFYNIYYDDKFAIAQIYSIAVILFTTIAFLILLIGSAVSDSIVGLLNIPVNILDEATDFYILCLFNLALSLIRLPYISYLIASEKMGLYSFISIIDAIIKFISIMILSNFFIDSKILLTYGYFLLITTLIVSILYVLVCYINIEMPRFKFKIDLNKLREVLGFSSWTIFGSSSALISQQGLSIILNKFFGVLLNSANAISQQIYTAVYQFVNSFQSAFSPYLMKTYAQNDISKVKRLIVIFSKISVFLYLLVALPLFLNMEKILKIWLVNIPLYAIDFSKLIIIVMFFEVLSAPLWLTIQASGNIRKYQITISSILISNIFLAYLLVYLHALPQIVFYSKILIAIFAFIYRVNFITMLLDFKIRIFIQEVIFPIVTLLFFIFSIIYVLNKFGWSFNLLVNIFLIILLTIILSYFLLMSKYERSQINKMLKKYI